MHDPAVESFAGWIASTALPFMAHFMRSGPNLAVLKWTAQRQPLNAPDRDKPIAFDPLSVKFLHDDTVVGMGIQRQPWHTAHTALALRPTMATFQDTFTQHVLACTALVGRNDTSYLFQFANDGTRLRLTCRLFVRGRINFLDRQACETAEDIHALLFHPKLDSIKGASFTPLVNIDHGT